MSKISVQKYWPRAASRMRTGILRTIGALEMGAPDEWTQTKSQQGLNFTLDEIQTFKEIISNSPEAEDVEYLGPDLFSVILEVGKIKRILRSSCGFTWYKQELALLRCQELLKKINMLYEQHYISGDYVAHSAIS